MGEITYRFGHIDNRWNQNYYRVEAYDGKTIVGYLDAISYQKKLRISMIEVKEEYRRRGIATAMRDRLIAELPDETLEPGTLTEDGARWHEGMESKRRYSPSPVSSSKKPILSFTLAQVLKEVDPNHIHHAEYTSRLQEPFVIRVYGSSILFGTYSSKYDRNHTIWKQKVIFKDFVVIARDKEIPIGDAVRYAIENLDFHIRCQCPSWVFFGYAYQATQLDYQYGLPRENRFPHIRNPNLRGSVCKHADKVMRWIIEHEDEIVQYFEQLYRDVDFSRELDKYEKENREETERATEEKRNLDSEPEPEPDQGEVKVVPREAEEEADETGAQKKPPVRQSFGGFARVKADLETKPSYVFDTPIFSGLYDDDGYSVRVLSDEELRHEFDELSKRYPDYLKDHGIETFEKYLANRRDYEQRALAYDDKAKKAKAARAYEPEELSRLGFDDHDFARYHKTGHLSSDSYSNSFGDEETWRRGEGTVNGYERISEFHNKERDSVVRGTIVTTDGTELEVRARPDKNQYGKRDENSEYLRDENGTLVNLTDEEVAAAGLPLYDTTLTVYDGDEVVAIASDEFGADGVWVRPSYQKRGIGVQLLRLFRKQFKHRRNIGQMTPAGTDMARAYFKRYKDEPVTSRKGFGVPKEYPIILSASNLNDAFWAWFRDSKVVNDDGSPLEVFHGTTKEFDAFRRTVLNPEGFWGAGFYFSNSIDDVERNYATLGPDLKSKIEHQLDMQATGDESVEELEALREKIRKQYMDHEGAVVRVYLRIQRPVIIGIQGETTFSYISRWNRDETDLIESGSLFRFADCFRAVASNLSYSVVDSFIGELFEKAADYEELSADAIRDIAQQHDILYESDENSSFLINELIRRAFQRMGFDGIIDYKVPSRFTGMRLSADTVHYIAFSPNQIKSIYNVGTWGKTHRLSASHRLGGR